jgi:hypothetical protein
VISEEIPRGNMGYLALFSEQGCLRAFTRTWCSQENYPHYFRNPS